MISFSIIMTCYNLEKYVAEAILSVFHQDYKGPMELIIVDDGSQDNSVAIINETVAKHGSGWDVRIVENRENLGVAGATDAGCKLAKHDWIMLADGDDIQMENRCSKTAEFIGRHPDAAVVLGSASHADKQGDVHGYQGYTGRGYDELEDIAVQATPDERVCDFMRPDGFPKWCFFGCGMTMNKEKAYTRWGSLIKEGCTERFAQDPVFAIRAIMAGKLVATREPACKYRAHDTNILNRAYDLEKLSGWFSRERHMQNFMLLTERNFRAQLDCVEYAREHSETTDLSDEQLARLAAHLESMAKLHHVLGSWWSYPWLKRLCLALRTPLPANFKRWPIPRLLPFWAFVTLRWFVKQKLRRKG